VSVVELNGSIVGKLRVRKAHLAETAHDILKCGRAEEVLLLETQFLALGSGLGIKNLGDVLVLLTLVKSSVVVRVLVLAVELLQIENGGRSGAPETEVDCVLCAKARDRSIIGSGNDNMAALPAMTDLTRTHNTADRATKLDLVVHITTADLPRVATLKPVVRNFSLLAVDNVLLEHSKLIADTIAPGRIVQSGKRVEETGSKTTKTTRTKSCISLFVIEVLEVAAKGLESLGEVGGKTHVGNGIAEITTHKILNGKVVHALNAAVVEMLLGIVPELNHTVSDTVGGGLVESIGIKVPLTTGKRELDVTRDLVHNAHGSLGKIGLGQLPEMAHLVSRGLVGKACSFHLGCIISGGNLRCCFSIEWRREVENAVCVLATNG